VAALHPVVAAASEGQLPPWARMKASRRKHAARVAGLLGGWAEARGHGEDERRRWTAAGHLHDALKDEDPESLRAVVPPSQRDLPAPVLHGPAAAARLREEGVDDASLLRAVAWHTLGHPELDALGAAVYAADFLEPGRDLRNRWRARLRERMPQELEAVVRTILQARLEHLIDKGRPIRPETIGFWNRMAGGRSWASASEL